MDYAEKIRDVMNKMRKIIDTAKSADRDLTDAEQETFDSLSRDVEKWNLAAGREKTVESIRNGLGIVVTPSPAVDPQGGRRRENMGNFLLDVARMNKGENPKFSNIQNIGTGLQSGVSSDGGFMLSQELVADLNAAVYGRSKLLPLVSQRPTRDGFSGIDIPMVNESSRADGSRAGGAQAFWAGEGSTGTYSKPKLRMLSLKLNKLLAFCAITEELLQDAAVLAQFVNDVYADEISYQVDDAILSGDGLGQPLGLINCGALITVTKKSGQGADTIVWENIVQMYSRLKVRNPANVAWLISQECFPELSTMAAGVGLGGVPVWLPSNYGAGRPYSTLLGYPVLTLEQSPKLGDAGDVVLADLSNYQWTDKNGVQGDTSIHVHFLTDESLFRFRYRCSGAPKANSATTSAKNPSFSISPYVALGAR
jgi:Predicted phage phi-C31 gp36 major capsid-like protein